MLSRPQPRCPSCRWFLAFEAVDHSWVGRCENRSEVCPVDVVPPTINAALVEFVRATGDTTSVAAAEHFGWSVPNAVNHLTKLTALRILDRRRVTPKRGGKRYVWTVARR